MKCTKTEASLRAVPLQAIALDAIERQPSSPRSPLLFPAERGGYLDLHNFRNRQWKPAQRAAGIEPLRSVYDLRTTTTVDAGGRCVDAEARARRCSDNGNRG